MIPMTIDGKPAVTTETFDVVNPATGAVEAQAPECSIEQLNEAMDAAQRAYQSSWRTDESARREALRAVADAIEAHHDELTELLILESGKPATFAHMENQGAPPWWRYYAGMDMPRSVVVDDATAFVEQVYRPLGVVAAITPWNGPLGLASWKIAPALRAGNTVVIKPSPFTPLSTLRLGEIMAGILPPGVVNVVSGGDKIGAAMTSHPIPRKISFTGSIEAGRHIAVSGIRDFKRITLEMGGNDAAILLDDIDVEKTVQALVPLTTMNCGQICAIPKRIFAPAALYDQVVDAFTAAYDRIVVGAPYDEGTQMGPLSTKPQFDRIEDLVSDAKSAGARVTAGGGPPDGNGYFFRPTVLADVAEGVRIVDEEQFGPALPILKYDSIDDAVARANNTEFGLCGSAWSSDPDRAAAVAQQLEVGTTFVNAHAILPPHIPFSGAKASGLGVSNGLDGLLGFTEPQVIHRVRA